MQFGKGQAFFIAGSSNSCQKSDIGSAGVNVDLKFFQIDAVEQFFYVCRGSQGNADIGNVFFFCFVRVAAFTGRGV